MSYSHMAPCQALPGPSRKCRKRRKCRRPGRATWPEGKRCHGTKVGGQGVDGQSVMMQVARDIT